MLREVLRRRGTVVAASSGGKLKTVLQILLIFTLVIPWTAFLGEPFLQVLGILILIIEFVVLVITVWSGAQYVLVAAKAMQDQKRDQ